MVFAEDPRAAYDRRRAEPLGQDEQGQWVVCRHADVVAVATNPGDYSSAVSRFLQIPNGLDGDEHRKARELLDPFFAPERMAALAPALTEIATSLVHRIGPGVTFDAVADLGARYAVRAGAAWLGWSVEIEEDLIAWMAENHAASRSGELERTAAVAASFDAIIRAEIQPRRQAGEDAPNDVTTELVRLRDADGNPLGDDVLVSVLRNWTGGDLGSLALCVGVVVYWLATHPGVQDELAAAADAELGAAIDEMLRIDDPFVSNRRKTTRPVDLEGVSLAAGERVVINWTAANRDPAVFGDPDRYDPAANAPHNLVYGIGPHVCPGRPLATLELITVTRALLAAGRLELAPDQAPEREHPPVGGFHRVPVRLH